MGTHDPGTESEMAALLERLNAEVALDRLLPNLHTMLARLRSGCCPSCGRPMEPPKVGQVREQRRASGGNRGRTGRPRR